MRRAVMKEPKADWEVSTALQEGFIRIPVLGPEL